jgi:hypothetical protein
MFVLLVVGHVAAHTDDRVGPTHRAVVGHTDKAVDLAAHDALQQLDRTSGTA